MKHSDISAALDALGAHFGITLKHRPNYTAGRVHVQLTPLDAPVLGISFDEALFSLKDRDDLSDQLHREFNTAAGLLCGASIVNAATSGVEPTFQLDAMDATKLAELRESLGRVFLALTEGDRESRDWMRRKLGLFSIPVGEAAP